MSRETWDFIRLTCAVVVVLTMLDSAATSFATSLEVMQLSAGPTFLRLTLGIATAVILGRVTYKVLGR